MSYRDYVVAAYAVFIVVLLWDFVVPRIQLRQQLRAARLRASRTGSNGRNTRSPPGPVSAGFEPVEGGNEGIR